jgi:hypothetical protein
VQVLHRAFAKPKLGRSSSRDLFATKNNKESDRINKFEEESQMQSDAI